MFVLCLPSLWTLPMAGLLAIFGCVGEAAAAPPADCRTITSLHACHVTLGCITDLSGPPTCRPARCDDILDERSCIHGRVLGCIWFRLPIDISLLKNGGSDDSGVATLAKIGPGHRGVCKRNGARPPCHVHPDPAGCPVGPCKWTGFSCQGIGHPDTQVRHLLRLQSLSSVLQYLHVSFHFGVLLHLLQTIGIFYSRLEGKTTCSGSFPASLHF